MSDTQFDPTTVPTFPVFHLSVQDGHPPRFNGTALELDPEEDPIDAVTTMAAREAEARNLDAVRVEGNYNGSNHKFVVRASGELYDLTPPPVEKKPLYKQWPVLITAFIGVLLLVLGTLTVIFLLQPKAAPPPAAKPSIPGANTPVPVQMPETFSSTATWALPVSRNLSPALLSDGTVLVANDDDMLIALNTQTAEQTWTGTDAPNDVSQVHETTWRGQPVLMQTRGKEIKLWARYGSHRTDVKPVEIQLDATPTVTYAGDSPLMDLGDYTVAVPTQDGAKRLSIPPGSVATAFDGKSVVSVGEDAVHTTTTDGKTTHIGFTPPKGVSGKPHTAVGLSQSRAIATWQKETHTQVALINTASGETLMSADVTNEPTVPDVTIDHAASTAVIGQLFVRFDNAPALVELPDKYRKPTLYGTTIYAASSKGPQEITIDGTKVKDTTWSSYSTNDPPPALVTDRAAYVVAEKVDTTYIYRVSRREKETS